MDSDKLKLLNQLEQLFDTSTIKNDVVSLIDAFSAMDTDAITLILEDEVSYQDTTKIIFIQKLKEVFKEFQKEDNLLLPYYGKCNSNECANKNKTGVAFIGNNSARYINFIIEEYANGSVKDIYNCYDFCTNKKVVDQHKTQLSLTVYTDEKNNFSPYPTYTILNNKSIIAINDLKQFIDCEISKEEIFTWLNNYENLFNSLVGHNLFYKNQSLFYHCFYYIKEICEFIMIEEEALIALEAFKSVKPDDEIPLLKWLVKFEYLYDNLILLHPYIVSEESLETGKINIYKDFNVCLKTDILKNCINLQVLFDEYYFEKLNKYTTLSKEEEENQIPFDDHYEKTGSLKYHLEKRGLI